MDDLFTLILRLRDYSGKSLEEVKIKLERDMFSITYRMNS